jgi:hypothetical protein
MRGLWGVLLLGLLCGGCASIDHLADTLNKRGDTACLWVSGAYGPFVGVSALIATGGTTIDQCRQIR